MREAHLLAPNRLIASHTDRQLKADGFEMPVIVVVSANSQYDWRPFTELNRAPMRRLRQALSLLQKRAAVAREGTATVGGRIRWMVTGGVVFVPAAALFVDPSVARHAVTQFTPLAQLYIAWQGRKKVEFDLVPKETKVTNDELVSAIQDAMLHPMCGLHILCAPRDSGKSYAVRLAGNRLLDTEQITGEL